MPRLLDIDTLLGYHLLNADLRIDDNPVEAGLERFCRKDGQYQGKSIVEKVNTIKLSLSYKINCGIDLGQAGRGKKEEMFLYSSRQCRLIRDGNYLERRRNCWLSAKRRLRVCFRFFHRIGVNIHLVGFSDTNCYRLDFARYVRHPKEKPVDNEFLKTGEYQIEIRDKKYPATLYIKSPFDAKNQRLFGRYENQFEEQSHFED